MLSFCILTLSGVLLQPALPLNPSILVYTLFQCLRTTPDYLGCHLNQSDSGDSGQLH